MDQDLDKTKKTILSLFSDWLKKNFSGFIVGFCVGVAGVFIYFLSMPE